MVDLLAESLEAVAAGQLTEDECKSCLDVSAGGVAPLLKLAWRIESVQHPEMDTTAFAAGRLRAQAEIAEHVSRKQGRVRLVRRIAWATIVLCLALFLVTTGTVLASTNSLPGEPLYSVKRTAEYVRLALTFRSERRSDLLIVYAQRRLEEVDQICSDRDCPETLLDDLAQQTEAAAVEIERVPAEARVDLLEKIVALTARQQEVLTRMLERASLPARSGLQRALERSQRDHEQARQSLEKEKENSPQGPPGHARTPGPPEKAHTPGQPKMTRSPVPAPDRLSNPQKTKDPKPTKKDKDKDRDKD
jgi:hypothetical protein